MNRIVAKIEMDNGMSIAIKEDDLPLLIGRDSHCGICVPFRHVSRHHCELYLDDLSLHLRDISRNGTKVGQTRVKGDSVSIDARTTIHIAAKAQLTVTPYMAETTRRERRSASGRRSVDRRSCERRSNLYLVPVERRSTERRTASDRRVAPH